MNYSVPYAERTSALEVLGVLLRAYPEWLPPKTIASRSGLHIQTVAVTLRRLKAEDYVESMPRRPNGRDWRLT